MIKLYKEIIDHYESCLQQHGDNHLGVDWPKREDVGKRYKTMLDIIQYSSAKDKQVTLLDFGCGTGHLNEFIINHSHHNISYSGLEISEKFLQVAKVKYPKVSFYLGDVLDEDFSFPIHDYIILNGVFTEKRGLSFENMWEYFTAVIKKVFQKCDVGVAFNVMSKNVDWERDDLFHVSMDLLSNFLCEEVSRNFVIRNDYGLYEYTTYILKQPTNG